MQSASQDHILSMVVMLNEKFRENVPAWDGFSGQPELIPVFFQRLFSIQQEGLKMHERTAILVFFIHAFQSLENDPVSKQVLRLVQLSSWHSLSPGRLQVSSLTPTEDSEHLFLICVALRSLLDILLVHHSFGSVLETLSTL